MAKTKDAPTQELNGKPKSGDEEKPKNSITVELPYVEPEVAGYECQVINIRLTGRQAAALRRIQEGADLAREVLPNGRRVSNAADAARLVFEKIADAADGLDA